MKTLRDTCRYLAYNRMRYYYNIYTCIYLAYNKMRYYYYIYTCRCLAYNRVRYYYYIYSYFKYINPIKQYETVIAKVQKIPKKCVSYKSRCTQIINNVNELLVREEQWR